MAAWGYEFYLLVRFAYSWEILSALEDNIRIPARPCIILYLIFCNSKFTACVILKEY